MAHSLDGGLNILGFTRENGVDGYSGVHLIDPSTVCQFTGLKDCEGNEIWEGDVLQDIDYDFKYIVIFAEGTFLAKEEGQCVGIPLHECIGDSGNVTYAKVIGNKFDKKK